MSTDEAPKRRAATASAWRLPDGYSRVRYRGKTYGLTVTRFNGGRSMKLFAEALGGGHVVSANLYRSAGGDRLRPCEMPADEVNRFLTEIEPLEGRC